jgi:hypothetical protein
LRTIRTNDPYLRYTDAVVDPQLDGDADLLTFKRLPSTTAYFPVSGALLAKEPMTPSGITGSPGTRPDRQLRNPNGFASAGR